MNILTRWLTRWHGFPFFATVFAVVVSVTFVARGSSDSDSSPSVVQNLLLGAAVVMTLIAIALVAARLAGIDPDAQLIAHRLVEAPDERRLLTRWLQRTRWARNVGGVAGLTWWVLGTSLQGDILLCGVGGIALGSMAAQLHHVRRVSGPRTATLEQRSVGDYISVPWRRRMIGVSLVSAALMAGGLLLDDTGSSAAWAGVALAVLALAYLVQWRVAARPRPALSSGLQQADDLARELAIDRGLAQPVTYFALVLIAHGAVDLEPSIGGLAIVIAVSAWLYALRSWWQNRRLGLDSVIDQPLPMMA